ncbi:hypothetical protein KO494_14720 [Lacinutrix sp. C3R15]|uniref:hypothetical protein n=1 Tax=Flavobacteriaceae TaxID=49546 RepID=UPI001C09E185|nr:MULTISPECIES: hypothetical protein [Flavobacteriaceae]MBU2940799.1 hypothetical protein [Lacinutrix sp. C3R15]MDO6624117.1 hypothetical protein [Oceanihabitans sp. 1_MG-2023]
MNMYIFKTSIEPQDIRIVNSILRAIIPSCIWTFDLEDCDRILRIKSNKNINKLVCFHLKIDGFQCEELQ